MTDARSLAARLRAGYRSNERKLILGYLGGLAVLVLLLAAAPVRRPVLGAAERAAATWDDRWTRRLAEAEALVEAGALDSAVIYLERLDRDFPARHVKHARDGERQRLLRALGNAYLQLDRNERALITFRRLAAFEPRSVANHYDLALACIQAGEEAEARQHLQAALAINPVHLPSVRAQVRLAYEVADYASVVAAYESYLRAFMVQELQIEAGAASRTVPVMVDAQAHDVSTLISLRARAGERLALDAGGLPVEVEWVKLDAPLVAGRTPAPPIVLQPTDGRAWAFVPVTAAGDTAAARRARPNITLDGNSDGVEQIEMRVRLKKPVDPTLWTMVERSYRNRLDFEGLARARASSFMMPSDSAADAVRRPE